MTREEAIFRLHSEFNSLSDSKNYKLTKFIYEIYDEFENKSCEGCKYDEKDDAYPTICWECNRYYADRYESKGKQ